VTGTGYSNVFAEDLTRVLDIEDGLERCDQFLHADFLRFPRRHLMPSSYITNKSCDRRSHRTRPEKRSGVYWFHEESGERSFSTRFAAGESGRGCVEHRLPAKWSVPSL